MKKIVSGLLFSTMLGFTAVAFAQDAPPANQPQSEQGRRMGGRQQADPAKQVQHLTKKLNLTSDQQSKLLPILTDRQEQMKTLMNDTSMAREDRRSKMQGIRSDTESKIQAILTDDQKQKYTQMQQEMKDHQGSPRQ